MNPFRSLLFATVLLTSAGLAQPPASDPAPAPAEASDPMQQAAAAIENTDLPRLFSDAAYAREIIAHVDTLQPLAKDDPEIAAMLDGTRMFAESALGHHAEALALARRLMANRPDRAPVYAGAVVVAQIAEKPLDALAAIEAASRHLHSQSARREFREGVNDDLIRSLRFGLHEAKDEAALQRLAEALLTLDWPGPDERERMDWQRVTVIDGRIERSDLRGARSIAADISTPAPLLRLLVARRYDSLFAADEDRVTRIRLALARQDTWTADRVAAAPKDPSALLDRAQFLRSVGRDAEALALMEPHVADMTEVERGGEKAFWLVNEAGYVLLTLGRDREALALMDRLLALGLDKHPQLINMAINASQMLTSAGRYREGADRAIRLAQEQTRYASPYGEMWMWSTAACGLALADDRAGAAPWLRRLEAGSADNEAAHMRALLCLDDLDAAERLLIGRLAGDEAADVLVALQNYELDGPSTAMARMLLERWDRLRARSAVQAAIEKVGRVMSLPMARTYWGEF